MKVRRKAFGHHAVTAVLEAFPEQIVNAWVAEGRQDDRMALVLSALKVTGVRIDSVSRSRLDALSEGQAHQGVIVEYLPPPEPGEDELFAFLEQLDRPAFLLVLDHVQDPHNLGACLRSANAAGVDAVIGTKDQSAGITPTVMKVASGAAERTAYYRVTNLARTLDRLKDKGIWIAGAAGEADQLHYDVDLRGSVALVVGAEGRGLRRLTRERCDFLVRIPMVGHVESLNVSVATGILLFEAVRQRKAIK